MRLTGRTDYLDAGGRIGGTESFVMTVSGFGRSYELVDSMGELRPFEREAAAFG
jgi:hypothetical protein